MSKTDATATVYAYQFTSMTVLVSTTYTVSRYVKYDGYDTTTSLEYNNGANWGGVSWVAPFIVTSGGVAAGATANCTSTVLPVGNGWYRVSATFTTGATVTTPSNPSVLFRITGASGVSVLMTDAQLELGSTATNYQNVVSLYDITEAGVQTAYGLYYDGVDDFLVTPTITPGTDKVQVFAGVRKLSDANPAMIVEHSAALTANNGSFYLVGPSSGGFANYSFGSKGTLTAGPVASGFAAPISNVVTGLGDISGDRVTIRVNGTQAIQSTADQGTGNYGAYPTYFGRRGGTTLPFNGYTFREIGRFGPNLDTATIANVENWINQNTGAY